MLNIRGNVSTMIICKKNVTKFPNNNRMFIICDHYQNVNKTTIETINFEFVIINNTGLKKNTLIYKRLHANSL